MNIFNVIIYLDHYYDAKQNQQVSIFIILNWVFVLCLQMRVILVFIFALVNVTTSVPIINSSLNDEWIHFKKKHGKDYENKNEIQRFVTLSFILSSLLSWSLGFVWFSFLYLMVYQPL